MAGTWRSAIFLTLGLLCERQVCNVRVSFECVPTPKGINVFSWCSPHVLEHPISQFFLIVTWMVRTKNTQRCILCLKTCSCFIVYERYIFFKLLRAISRQCFLYGRKLDHGGSSCSYQWWCSSQLHHHKLIYHSSCRLVHKDSYEPCIDIMINETKYNHPKGHWPWDDCKTRSDLAQKTSEMSRRSMIFVMKFHAHEESGLISGKKNSRMFMAP